MEDSGIKLYYKNVTSEVIGSKHGITAGQFDSLSRITVPVIQKINDQRQDGKTPYRELPYNTETPQRVKELVAELKGNCENLVVLGIGGSALGNITLQTALNPYMYNIDDSQRNGPRLFVFDNVDPAQLASFLDWISGRLDRTIFNVISKSGRTAETASQLLIVRQMLIEKMGPEGFKNQVVATTDPKTGTLRTIADEHSLRTLDVPEGVGGRFSVLSAVGLFSAAMCGIDIDSLLAGARDMDLRVSDEDFFKNPAAINAVINYHFYNNGKTNCVMMPYCYALKDLVDWFRQLWAESLGKEKNNLGNEVHIGPTPIKALGTTDQHSQVQLYREGPNDKLFTFLEVKNFARDIKIGPAPEAAPELEYLANADLSTLINSEKKATEYALIQDARPNMTILFEKVDPYSVGQFIYLYEVTTSIAGSLFGINAYDQPAVELGKEATFALMGRQQYQELAQKIQPFLAIDEKFLI
ncbi:MAG: glucose-6-phosphate isomerase [Planctomycetota bacterium]|jgi:glucose-6-phosphate isomerase